MKTPPIPAERLAPTASTAKSERDRSFLIFAGVVLVAIALGFKSELLGEGQVWALALALVVVAAPALLGYLRGTAEFPRIEHYILVMALYGAYLVVVALHFNPILQLLWIFTITFLASYRAFRVNGSPIASRRSFIFALFVAQVVTFLAWAVTALQLYLIVNDGIFAVMLFFAWYINRGLVRHTVEESFTRNVVLEYGAFAVILVYLFVSSYQPGR
jgi:hypothetical protein